MQPTDNQVERSLEALSARPDAPGTGPGDRIPRDTLEVLLSEIPADLLSDLRNPAVRPDRLAEAQERLAAGSDLTDDDLANRIVGRLVCDRLR